MAPLAPVSSDTTSRCVEEQEKKRKKKQQTNKTFGIEQIGVRSVGGTWLWMRAMQRLVCSVNKFSSLVGR